MKLINSILFFIFIFRTLVFSEDIIQLNFEGNIIKAKSDGNYIGIITKRNIHPYYSAFLYDVKGKKLFEHSIEKSVFIKAEPIVSRDLFVIIQAGWPGGFGNKETPDQIQAFSIKTGNLLWQTTSSAADYETSPDGSYILTNGGLFERRSRCEYINTIDGKITQLPVNYAAANWIDHERIIMALQESEENPEWLEEQKHKKILFEKRRAIEKRRDELNVDFKNAKITKIEYDKELVKNDNDLKKIEEEINQYSGSIKSDSGRRVKRRKHAVKDIRKAAKLLIYNIETKLIEKQAYIFDDKNNKITTTDFSRGVGGQKIHIDPDTKDIYFICDLEIVRDGKTEVIPSMVKIDNSLKTIWVRQNVVDVRKIYTEQGYNFITLSGDNVESIDKKSGELKKIEQVKKDSKIEINDSIQLNGKIHLIDNKTIKID